MHREVVLTEDGSYSVFVKEFDESYHSLYGAVQESNHVFINAGLKYRTQQQKTVSIFEMGLGTGLNCLLSYYYAKQHNLAINYTAIEKYPLEPNLIDALQQNDTYNNPFITKIHQLNNNTSHQISDKFMFRKIAGALEDFNTIELFDIIYYDAFAPSAQPELWTNEIFEKLFHIVQTDGILVTYCAKGSVKRNLKNVGFCIESLPGPKNKREMIRAIKK